jgi:SIR2-like domain
VKDKQWEILIDRIRAGECTPFLGAGAAHGVLPLGGDVAEDLATQHEYPLSDKRDLARVAQFIGVSADPMRPKELIRDRFEDIAAPDFRDPHEPHALMADLPLPLYMTTNYDDFMLRALRDRNRNAEREICKWNASEPVKRHPSPLAASKERELTKELPLIFHLHGHLDVLESLVLTEDDYLDFLVAIAEKRRRLLPHQVTGALSSTSLIFIGYALADWDFRVLHRGLVVRGDPSLRRLSVTVQLSDKSREEQDYLNQYFEKLSVSVFWGNAQEFCSQLRERWEASGG